MSEVSSSEQVIRRLYQITNDYKKGFSHQINELIRMGLDRFSLDIGILSKIDGNDYVVKYCVTPEDIPMQPGDRFDFDVTYCSITCAAQAPVALEHIGEDDQYGSHPAYKAFGLESYIGIPIRPNGELYGTLNFSSPTPYARQFHDIDIDAIQLMASWIEVELIRRKQERQLYLLNQELQLLADHDTLTNIPNRRGMYKQLHKGLNQINRKGGEGVLAIVDIDHFKKLNDTYGHQVGDEALIATAQAISASLRDYDFVARFGGEEFLLWLPDTCHAACAVASQRIMDNIAKISLTHEPITVSIGACHYMADDEATEAIESLIDTLISRADKALYQAKELGRNRLVNYSELAAVS